MTKMASLAKSAFLLAIITLVAATQFELMNSADDDGKLRFPTPDALEWSAGMAASWAYDEFGDGGSVLASEEEERRSLFWRAARYYISYGALSANRVPCPPRSGRSYYTHNCFRATGPVRPYFRGCSAISRCRR
uniref:Uncharacterized protein n=1 Tax=Kalanchoe fedtschenkoi TaxID=63787 RepID=A0A7N0T9T3_KALFE